MNIEISDQDGNRKWYQNGLLHRDDNLPAIECKNGDKYWYQNGLLHRDWDLPARVSVNGNNVWYQNGEIHRDGDQPAVTYPIFGKWWYRDGLLHRDGDKHAIEYANGSKTWYKYGNVYSHKQIISAYAILKRCARRCLSKIRMRKLRRVRWIHGELLCKPPSNSFPGGQDYQKMADYFNKL